MNVPFQVAEDGKDALSIMQANTAKGTPIDLLVSDIKMPGLDGMSWRLKCATTLI